MILQKRLTLSGRRAAVAGAALRHVAGPAISSGATTRLCRLPGSQAPGRRLSSSAARGPGPRGPAAWRPRARYAIIGHGVIFAENGRRGRRGIVMNALQRFEGFMERMFEGS